MTHRNLYRMDPRDIPDVTDDNERREHQRIADDFNGMLDCVSRSDSARSKIEAFDRWVDTLQTHFANEEQAMVDMGYPRVDEHRSHHRHYLDNIHALRRDIDDGRVSLSYPILETLKTTTLSHMQSSDMAFEEWVAQKNSTTGDA